MWMMQWGFSIWKFIVKSRDGVAQWAVRWSSAQGWRWGTPVRNPPPRQAVVSLDKTLHPNFLLWSLSTVHDCYMCVICTCKLPWWLRGVKMGRVAQWAVRWSSDKGGVGEQFETRRRCVLGKDTSPEFAPVGILANPPDFRGRLPISLPPPGVIFLPHFSRFLTKSDLLRTVSTRTLIQRHHCLVSMVA